jgi:DNA-binding NarL/FixJ family response regulator
MSSNEKIRVLIADDFAMLRQVINMVLEKTDDIEVVGEAPDLEDALKDVQVLQLDVILMNDYLPPINSALATKKFRELGVDAAILIISMHADTEMIQQSFVSGANGLIYKEEMGTLLTEAIRKVHNKEQYLSPMAEDALAHQKD